MLSKIGTGELLIILIIALFVVGPEKLPTLAKAAGKAIAGFKKYMNEVTDELKEESEDFKSISKEVNKIKKDVTSSILDIDDDVKKTLKDTEKEINL